MKKVYLLLTSFDQKARPGWTPRVWAVFSTEKAAYQRIQEMEEEKKLGQLPDFWSMHVEEMEVQS